VRQNHSVHATQHAVKLSMYSGHVAFHVFYTA